jgi:RimJ/RimL family protein N-acetyltransferase
MNIEYKLLTSKDLNSYRKVRLECLKAYPDFFGTSYDDEVKAKSLKFDKALLENSQTDFLYGAFDKDNLVGICGFTQENRIKTSHRGEISQMFVKKDFSGQGIGTRLLLATLNKTFHENNIELITLGVVDKNKYAIDVYKKIGFTQFGFIENYFKQGNSYCGFVFMVLTKVDYGGMNTS